MDTLHTPDASGATEDSPPAFTFLGTDDAGSGTPEAAPLVCDVDGACS